MENYREKPNVVGLVVTDNDTGKVKSKMFDDLSCLVLRALYPYQMEKVNKATWMAPLTLLITILSFR